MPGSDKKTALATAAMRLPMAPPGGVVFFRPLESPDEKRRGIAVTGWSHTLGPWGAWLSEQDIARALHESGRVL